MPRIRKLSHAWSSHFIPALRLLCSTHEDVASSKSLPATRFEALGPLRQGVKQYYGGFGQEIAAGLQIRYDHGPQFMRDHSTFSRRSVILPVERSFHFQLRQDTSRTGFRSTPRSWRVLLMVNVGPSVQRSTREREDQVIGSVHWR